MRKLKYRAWDLESERMVELIDVSEQYVFSKRLLHPDQFIPMIKISNCITGDVFEGDIVRFDVLAGTGPSEPFIRGEIGIVTFNSIGGAAYGTFAAECCRYVRVIGNVYEDKDLSEELRLKHEF